MAGDLIKELGMGEEPGGLVEEDSAQYEHVNFKWVNET